MNIPSEKEYCQQFSKSDRLKGIDALGGFAYNLDMTVPYVVTAIHAGHSILEELAPYLAISEADRMFEEDVATDQIIKGNLSTIWALDSRAEYDLNRTEEQAVPFEPGQFWGLSVYRMLPPAEIKQKILSKYRSFYRFMGEFAHTLVSRFGICVIYDIHSYNISRQVEKGFEPPPVFNLGTSMLNRDRWKPLIDSWMQELSTISIFGHSTTVAENLVFQGRGALCQTMQELDENILVLPTEISKIYMNEHTGILKQSVITELNIGLKKAVDLHSRQFLKRT